MGFLTRVYEAGRALLGTTRQYEPPWEPGWNSDPGPIFGGSGRGLLALSEEANRLASVVGRIAEDVAAVKWRLAIQTKDGKLIEVPSNKTPIHQWMDSPWLEDYGGTWWELMFLTAGWVSVLGEAFWLVRQSGDRIETVPVCPHDVSVRPGDDGSNGRFLVANQGRQTAEWIPATDMVWFRRPSLRDTSCVRGKAHSVRDEVNCDESASKYANSFFRNGGRPDFIVFSGELDDNPSLVTTLQRNWDQRHRGPLNAGRPAFLPYKGSVQQLQSSLKDMALSEIRRGNRDAIWQAYQVPPEIMGAVENSNRATAQAALEIYQLNAILPLVTMIQQQIARAFMPRFRIRGLILVSEEVVKDSREFRLKKATDAWKAGLITRNQALKELGYDQISGDLGDQYLIPLNTVQIDANGKPMMEAQNADHKAATDNPKGSGSAKSDSGGDGFNSSGGQLRLDHCPGRDQPSEIPEESGVPALSPP